MDFTARVVGKIEIKNMSEIDADRLPQRLGNVGVQPIDWPIVSPEHTVIIVKAEDVGTVAQLLAHCNC